MNRSPKKANRQSRSNEIFDIVARGDKEGYVRAIQAGCNVNVRDSDERTPLHLAAADGCNGIVLAAIEAGGDPNLRDRSGWTPLHFAAQNYFLDVASTLLANHADPDLCDEDGNTPLSNAVFSSQGRSEMIDLLLKAGADPDKRNNFGVSPRSLAASIANFNVPFPKAKGPK